jgi:hypothetical protein
MTKLFDIWWVKRGLKGGGKTRYKRFRSLGPKRELFF